MASFVELTIDQGADFSSNVTVRSANGVVINVTSYTITSKIRKNYSTTTSTSFATNIVDASNGIINLTMTAANTTNLTPGRLLYDVLAISSSNVRTRASEGIVTVLPSITR